MSSSRGLKRLIRWSLIAIAALALVTRVFFVGRYRIPQNGMFPSLPAGTAIFTAKRAYGDASKVRRGDIIVFEREEDGQRYNYIWRVVALPGESVQTSGESLTINGQPAQRKLVREAEGARIFREQIGDAAYEIAFGPPPDDLLEISLTVPADHFFVMGDNRFHARDSREFGPIPFSSIRGKKL